MVNYGDTRLHPSDWRKIFPCPMSGCWLWFGAQLANGYGSVGIVGYGDRSCLAHRYVYTMLVGPIQNGLHIDHRCRVKCCVNPAHLEAVTQQVNNARGAFHRRKTHCIRGHALEGDNLIWRRGRTERACRACVNLNNRRYRARANDPLAPLRPLTARDFAEIDALFAAVSDAEIGALNLALAEVS